MNQTPTDYLELADRALIPPTLNTHPGSLWSRGKMQNHLPTAGLPTDKWPLNPFWDQFHEIDSLRMANVLVSRDEGATWDRRGGARIPWSDFDEHNLVERRDGNIWMTARSGDNHGMWQSISQDRGATWSQPNPNAVAARHAREKAFSERR